MCRSLPYAGSDRQLAAKENIHNRQRTITLAPATEKLGARPPSRRCGCSEPGPARLDRPGAPDSETPVTWGIRPGQRGVPGSWPGTSQTTLRGAKKRGRSS